MWAKIIISIFLILEFEDWVGCEDHSWDFFVFTQQWTPSVCEDAGHEHKCQIPKEVKGWTVHGLWPNKKGSETPNFCNESLKFDWKKIESLKSNLTAQWPNVFVDTNATDFWEHEWNKHGTCAVTLETTGTEYKYFSKALQLNTHIDLYHIMKKFNVVPSKTIGYQASKLVEVLSHEFPGSTPKLQCTYDKAQKQQLLMEIELCLDKVFNFVPCDNPGPREGDCHENEPLYIWPLPNEASVIPGPRLTKYFKLYYSAYSIIKN